MWNDLHGTKVFRLETVTNLMVEHLTSIHQQ